MTSSGKSTRWGALLSQAVAGVEARLDTILAETEEAASNPPKNTPAVSAQQPATPTPDKPRSDLSSRTNDRLQERLARAVGAKNATAKPATLTPSPTTTPTGPTPRQSVDVPSTKLYGGKRPGTPSNETSSSPEAARSSTEVAKQPSSDFLSGGFADASDGQSDSKESDPEDACSRGSGGESPLPDATTKPSAREIALPISVADHATSIAFSTGMGADVPQPDNTLDQALLLRIKKLEDDLQKERQGSQDEMHHYVEKIESLQSKLQYMSREAAETHKKTIQSSAPDSLEKKLAEKDQQIAQLMEEGKNLGITEQKHRAILKKLRARIGEDENRITELTAAQSKIDAELQALRPRTKRAAELEKSQEELLRRLAQTQGALESLRSESASKDAAISDLRSQLDAVNEQVAVTKMKIDSEALEKEQQHVKELEEQVATVQLEKTLAADRARAQIHEWKDKAERAAERARAIEVEATAEVQIIENKLEAIRARAEEASSGATGDSQAKLLRQVETLQTQYAIASENWQGIEATLLARIARLEKERDEALQRESDMRKKAREAALRAKRNEEDLEELRSKLPKAQQDEGAHQTLIESLTKQADQAETALRQVTAELESLKVAWKEEKQERERGATAVDLSERDRRAWLEDLPARPHTPLRSNSRPESPLVQGPPGRTWSSDFLGLQALPNKQRKVSGPPSQTDPSDPTERLLSRRPSAQPPARPFVTVGSNASYKASPSVFSPTATEAATSSIILSSQAVDLDDPLEGVQRSSSPHQVVQDMVSVSTVAAGPTVQLVERMSAAIRRLESEKVAAREELARISNQRNEARAEVLALLKDTESGRAAVLRVKELEAEVIDIKARYDTTLELLGEKSELVEELRADVEDVKAMYRDLIERTVK